MKKYLLTIVAAILATSSVWGQKYPDGYLTDETRPTQYDFVKAPPALTSGAFAYDFYYYQWGRDQRDGAEVSQQALEDEAAELFDVFGQDSIIASRRTERLLLKSSCCASVPQRMLTWLIPW